MQIVGCDLHTRQQTVAFLDPRSGKLMRRVLYYDGDTLRDFYNNLPRPALVGIEATGSMQWFLELMEELGIECKVGHPADVRAADPRWQKHDKRDARLIYRLLEEDRFPAIWMPSVEQRDARTLLAHRHQLVRLRTQLQNALQSIALAHGMRKGSHVWSRAGLQQLRAIPLPPHTSERRDCAVELHQQLQSRIDQLDVKVARCAEQRPLAQLLMTHPGVGPNTAVATETILGDPKRFPSAKDLCSYVGLIPTEASSANKRRLGRVSKQGSAMLRFFWCEAAAHAVRKDDELKRFYQRKLVQKGLGKAKVACARKLGVRLWIMLRDQIDYDEFCRRGRQARGASSGDA